MWLLFHRNAKTRPVRDGNSFVECCPECGNRATFVEVEITENVGMFFVDLIGDKERAYRCCACGETFDLKTQSPTMPAKSLIELDEDDDELRREAAHAKAVRIEDELAELKKRLGR